MCSGKSGKFQKAENDSLLGEQGAKASSGTPGRRQSLGSALDYKRTAHWLRDVLNNRESYTTRFTERPAKNKQDPSVLPEQRRKSESMLSNILSARRLTRNSSQSTRKSVKFDGRGFKRAVNDLEKLLNEALAIASHVVDRPGTPARKGCKPPSSSLRSRRRSVSSGNMGSEGSLVNLTPACAQETAGSMEEVELDEVARPKRPTCRHAATYSGLSRRPRLNEILQSYSGEDVETKTRESTRDLDHAHEASLSGPKVAFEGLVGSGGLPANMSPGEPTQLGEMQAKARKIFPNVTLPVVRCALSTASASGGGLTRQPTARDWSPIRKRFVAAVACISTALVGVILGIYAGLVPSIQYYIIDQSHATVHGNTGCFLGLAVPTLFLWPLPLLHGRKPYILSSLVLAMPLLFPQALAVNSQRLTNTQSWRSMLLIARTLMGASLGFASMNFHSILTDLFGASLMSVNPHQEVVDQYDARRHGGGMGVWLGIWTWCWIGSLGVGFLVGACIIDSYPPAWGFYVSIIIIAVVLFLNVVCPEVRRSAFRRSIAEVRTGSDISRRIARGEIMMHRVKTGPKWWGQEVYHGLALSFEMLRQPGFAILTLYSAWIYAQVVLIIVLLGSLASRLYQLRSPKIGLLVGSMALGACLAIPFQKANVFSRSRQAQMNNNLATLNRKVAWSSHLVRRTIFTLLLPLAGICYAAVSSGPPLHISVPTLFAGFVGFLSCLAIAECNGLVMENFDCSDLSSGMVGRQRGGSGKNQQKRTNYSSFPRVTAGFAVIHGLAFVLAAGATALGGLVTRTLGQQVSTGVVAGILFILSVMLLLVLIRFTEVQIIPQCKSEAMDKLVEARRRSSTRRASMPNDPLAIMEEEMAWRPVMIGNPTGKKRRMNILELGGLTRWNEIRKKNKLIDEGAHLNRAAWDQGMEALDDQMSDLQRDAREFFGMSSGRSKGTRHLRRTDEGSETADESMEMENIEMPRAGAAPRGRARRHPERCAMSQTSGEEGEEARGARHRH
ncbi:Major facilitator superfamily transporter [Hirsutella rhossiliensis]|uniref:Major facilitator superfamily transporter n=1 Tax=Hirsutella rhossiliensis TaxID=111463 RepID=A0A9P8SFX3_9HYPO|nr:Major facilitator superfamily transporter [Hirsutella rhossiliensis]KAH0959451.1 Major facilitator superfamily transporter [Hirsutella rhossiliensis]